MTQREQILAQVGALLNGAGKPGGVPVAVRTRSTALNAENDLPAITYYPAVDRVREVHGRAGEGVPAGYNPNLPVVRALDVDVECVAAGDGASPGDKLVDDLAAWVVAALVPADWSGLALGVAEVQTEFLYEVRERPVVLARVTMRIHYTTRAGDLAART